MSDEPNVASADWPPRLTVDTARILEILTGDRFYSTKDASLREAVLNAIDACTRRASSDSSLRPAITVEFDDERLQVTVSDNGDGMSRTEVAGLFTRIGASMAQLATDVEIVGEFGIGVVSYFLVSDDFTIDSRRAEGEPVAVAFTRAMLDGTTPSHNVPSRRTEQGTTLTLQIRVSALYQLLLDRFSHWFRGVSGLSAQRTPNGAAVNQGRSATPSTSIDLDLPEWAESVELGPPVGFERWALMDGRATVDVLYRGVYVETQTINGLWGMEGSISVHPKRLKPRLNREGFVAEDLTREVVPFLNSVHPEVLRAGLATLADALDDPESTWTVNRLVTLWLAVPRRPEYQAVVDDWDALFRSKRLFRHLTVDGERDLSLNDLLELPAPLYLAPDNLASTTDIVRSAARVLRAKRASVVQGFSRDTGFMNLASFAAQSTAELLLSHFSGLFSEVTRLENVAEQIVAQNVRVAELFGANPKVALTHLGEDSAPLVVAAGELWLNLDTEGGRAIVRSVCDENLGRRSLLLACHAHAEQHVGIVAPFVRTAGHEIDRLGLVTREYLRGLAS